MNEDNFTQQFWWKITLAGLGVAMGAWLVFFWLG